LDRLGILWTGGVANHQAKIGVADERAEPSVREAPERVGRYQSLAERPPVRLRGFGQYGLAIHAAEG
jgi:hypothetical protein